MMRLLILSVFVTFISFEVFSQVEVSGFVLDPNGDPIPGATITTEDKKYAIAIRKYYQSSRCLNTECDNDRRSSSCT